GVGPRTIAVEIGPGPGTLTAELARRAGGVLAVEFDTRLRPLHQDAFGTHPEVQFLYGDALRVDLAAAARDAMTARGLHETVLAGNLPFQITSPLLFGQTGPGVPWRRMTLMVQKEVADRICAGPHTKDYGILTVKLAYWWRVAERFEVGAELFFPRPKVDAAVLVFEPIAAADRPAPGDWPALSAFVDAAFAQRRKMLVNSLAARWPPFPGKTAFAAATARLAVPPQCRAEDLTPDQLRRLCRALAHAQSNNPNG
ncbi:MAG: 16S rRNA (adenine(1518)-N(6)/adenine(1519)-N(6))-dimethyltransferase RsmA, partial [bacterium]|nr:16S rRNA (adenine(1518)-N(6)/adenine(1519)-N(6))-dimethyltransferase RsmA [bacterium]